MRVPKIIHQQWGSPEVPERFRDWVDGWRRLHPDWSYRLWTDETCTDLVRRRYPAHFELYNSYDMDVKRHDAFRYFLLHCEGGLYVDLDCECLRPLDPLFDGDVTCLLGSEPRLHAVRLYRRENLAGNAILASTPGHRFWEHVFGMLRARADADVVEATGPLLMQAAVESYPHPDLTVLESDVFYPLADYAHAGMLDEKERQHHERMARDGTYPAGSHAVHHWAGTWYRGSLWTKVRRLYLKLRSKLGIGRY